MKKFLLVFLLLFIHSQVPANEKQKSNVTTSISEQLKTLQDLYKSGILSGYEYEKEKKKILNN
ncbi:MAG: SHOCT domain-containing protein [Candidatus Pelagibacter sp. TMED263]|nr:MAG: SHOCT domain-containing protein [Candidatus Pelagibacter sp. TMED263]|tara:strand:+ start:259 stop:447 length:189 start_codon:yes stop_codon:yes gene_type:complete